MSSLPSYANNLVPIYINVVSSSSDNVEPQSSHQFRIVDTILFDTSCWPIPLYDPIEDAIEENVNELAYTMVTDLEVQGMGRTVRHFTGRIEIYNQPLENLIKDQLRKQLYTIALNTTTNNNTVTRKRRQQILNFQLSQYQKEKEKSQQGEHDNDEKDSKKRKRDDNDDIDNNTETKSSFSLTNNNRKEQQHASKQSKISALQAQPNNPFLIPIKIRLSVMGIRIHDDFVIDLTVPNQPCPITIARNIGRDLNLSEECIVSIAISIIEQLNGIETTASIGAVTTPTSDITLVPSFSDILKGTTGAWNLDKVSQTSNITHLVTLYKPK